MNFSHWYQKPEQVFLKSSLLHILKAIDEIKSLSDFMQIGMPEFTGLDTLLTKEQHLITVSDSIYEHAGVISLNDLLPIKSKSIDFILVMHSFETSQNAHAFIREVNRVLKDDGLIVVVALNKPSFVNIVANLHCFFSPTLDVKRTVPINKMDDWFSVLGYTKIQQCFLFNKKHLDEIFNGKLSKINRYLFHCGTVYSSLYKKSVVPLTYDTDAWKQKSPLKPILMETRNQHKDIK